MNRKRSLLIILLLVSSALPLFITVPTAEASELVVSISHTYDDIWVTEAGNIFYNTFMVLMLDDEIGIHAFLRFRDLEISKSAKINYATLKVYVAETHETPDPGSSVTIYGIDEPDCTPFTSDGSLWSLSRPYTSASVNWNLTDWAGYRSVNVTDIVKEIINQYAWSSGNDLGLQILGASDSGQWPRSFEDYSHAYHEGQAQLTIVYDVIEEEDEPPVEDPIFVEQYDDYTIWLINGSLGFGDWAYRKGHSIAGSTAGNMTDYPLRFKVYLETTNQWEHYEDNPIFEPGTGGSWDDDVVHFPFVLKIGETYYMYYSGRRSATTSEIGLATSPDGINFTRIDDGIGGTSKILEKGGGGDWNGGENRSPFVVYDNETYYLFYTAHGTGGTNPGEDIGLATSSDGKNFTNYGANPIIENSGAGWRKKHVSHCSVTWDADNDRWVLITTGYNDTNYENIGRFYCTQEDFPGNWTEDVGNNPVIECGTQPPIDDQHIHTPKTFPSKVDGLWYVFYVSAGGPEEAERTICFATTPSLYNGSFTKSVNNPVVGPTDETWEAQELPDVCCQFKIGDYYYMYYRGDTVLESGSIGLARSPVIGAKGDILWTNNTIGLDDHARDDFGDVRFTSSDGVTDLDYGIEKMVNGEYAIFWVKIDDIPASPSGTIIYVYYGNPGATTTANMTNIWIEMDDYSSDPTISRDNGGSSESLSIWDITNRTLVDHRFEFDIHIYSYSQAEFGAIPSIGPRFELEAEKFLWVDGLFLPDQTSYVEGDFYQNAWNDSAWVKTDTAVPWVDDGWYKTSLKFDGTYKMDIRKNRTDVRVVIDAEEDYDAKNITHMGIGWYAGATLPGSVTYDGVNDWIDAVCSRNAGGHVWFYLDNFRVGKYCDPEPAHVGWGAEEAELDDIYILTDENGTIIPTWNGANFTDLDDLKDWVDDNLIPGGGDPLNPDPGTQGWDTEGPWTRFRMRLYFLFIGLGCLFTPLWAMAYKKFDAVGYAWCFIVMVLGVGLLWSITGI